MKRMFKRIVALCLVLAAVAALPMGAMAAVPEEDAVTKAVNVINNIGVVTAGSELSIGIARDAYDRLSDADKAKVTNAEALTKAEAAFAEILDVSEFNPASIVEMSFNRTTNSGLASVQMTEVKYEHTNGGVWEYGTANAPKGRPAFNMGKLCDMALNGKYWYAFKMKLPEAGVYNLSVNNYEAKGLGCVAGLFIFPTSMSLDAPAEGQTNPTVEMLEKRDTSSPYFAGTFDTTVHGNQKMGTVTIPEAGEYYVVFVGIEKIHSFNAYVSSVRMTKREPVLVEAVEAVKTAVDAIGEVTVISQRKIQQARAAFDALTEDQKKLVYAPQLEAAEAAFEVLKQSHGDEIAANTAAVADAEAKVDAIGTVSHASKDAIDAARRAYDALTADQKELFAKLDTLTAAEEAYKALPAQESTEAAGNDDKDTDTDPQGSPVALIVAIVVVVLAAAGVGAYLLLKKKKSAE